MARPRAIAFLSEHASPMALRGSVDAGGQNVYVDEVARGLGRLGYQVDVFTRRDDPDAPEVLDWAPGVRLIQVDAGPAGFVPKDELWPLMPDFRDWILDFMTRHSQRYDLLHGNFWMSGWVAAELRERLGIPIVQIFHAMGKTKRRHQGEADTSPPDRIAVEYRVVDSADRLIAQCPSEADELRDDYGARPDRIELIPSAVNTRLFHPVDGRAARQSLGLDPDELLVVYVGRMLPRKDVRNIVRAVAMLRTSRSLPVRLLVVGGETAEPDPRTTPEIGELQRLASELQIADRVLFTGKRQPEELHLYYGAADVAVTTPWYEPFGLTPLEAMACGRPVFGSAVGGITYTVADGVTGYLVPPRDPAALADRLGWLLDRPRLRHQMGEAARRRVSEHFTWSRVARRTAELYERLWRTEPAAAIQQPVKEEIRL